MSILMVLATVSDEFLMSSTRGGTRNFSTGGLTLPTRGLKYGF